MSAGDAALDLAFETADAIYGRLFGGYGKPKDSLGFDELEDLIRQVLESAARRYVSPRTPLLVTDGAGATVCTVVGLAPYREADHCPQGGTEHCGCATFAGFRIRWPDGREEIVASLHNAWSDHFGLGAGPWDGSFSTLVRPAAEPAPAQGAR